MNGSSLVKIMASRLLDGKLFHNPMLTSPQFDHWEQMSVNFGSRYKTCWDIVNWALKNKLQRNLKRNSNIFIKEKTFENVVCELLSISCRSQCVTSIIFVDQAAEAGSRDHHPLPRPSSPTQPTHEWLTQGDRPPHLIQRINLEVPIMAVR